MRAVFRHLFRFNLVNHLEPRPAVSGEEADIRWAGDVRSKLR
jgi:hypothetical protein